MDRLLLLLLLPLLRAGSLQQNPWYQLQVQESVTVQEGLCVLVPCTVSYPLLGQTDSTPIYGEWFQKVDRPSQMDLPMATNNPGRGVKKKRKIPFHLLGDPGANNCSLGITDARKGDSGNYYFQLMRGDVKHSYKNNLLIVNVTALTRTPDIYIKEPLESGSSSHVTCSVPGACDRATPPTISWTGAALRPPGLDSKGAYNSSEILLTPGPQDHGTNLTCRVTFHRAGVSTERTVMLNVSYAPQNLTISISRGNGTELNYLGNGSSLPVLEGESLRLACVTDSNPPATLSWSRGSRTLSPSHPSNPGVLQVPRVVSGHEGEFTCLAQHPQGSLWTSVRLSVQNAPQLLGPSCSQEEEGLHCDCSSRAQPAPSLRWRLGEGLLEGNFSNASFKVTSNSAGPWANSSLSLREGLSSGLRLGCEAQNVHGAQSATVLLLPGKPKLGREFILGAVGGAGIAGLLSLCSCLIFFTVKTFRKAPGEKDAPSMLGPTSQGYQHECPPGSPRDLPLPVVAAPTSGVERELHYASPSFYMLRPWEPQDQEAASTTEYAEIKIHK